MTAHLAGGIPDFTPRTVLRPAGRHGRPRPGRQAWSSSDISHGFGMVEHIGEPEPVTLWAVEFIGRDGWSRSMVRFETHEDADRFMLAKQRERRQFSWARDWRALELYYRPTEDAPWQFVLTTRRDGARFIQGKPCQVVPV